MQEHQTATFYVCELIKTEAAATYKSLQFSVLSSIFNFIFIFRSVLITCSYLDLTTFKSFTNILQQNIHTKSCNRSSKWL